MTKIFQRIEQGYAGKRKGLPYTRYISLNVAKPFTWAFYRLKFSPNMVTCLAFLLAMAAVGSLFLPVLSVVKAMLFLVLLQLSYALDCSDGQLARLTGRASPQGAWFDLLMDRVTGFGILAGLFFWYWTNDLFAGFGQFYIVFVFCLFINLTFSYAANLKGLLFKSQTSPGKESPVRELVFFLSDTGVFYLLLAATVFIYSFIPLVIYSIYKAVLLAAVIGRTLTNSYRSAATDEKDKTA